MPGFRETGVAGLHYAYDGELVHAEQSEFQRIEVYDNPSMGRMLVLDGLVQTTTADEFVYHEMLAHVPLLSHPDPKRVLIIGGGDGGTLRRVLEHPGVEQAVMVEIDGRVIEVSREHLASIGGDVWGDPRGEVVVGDGAAYVADGDGRFDVVLCDSSDPVGPGMVLFTPEFYGQVLARLNPGGLFAAQSGGPLFQQGEVHLAYTNASKGFPEARLYLGVVPTYPGTLWSWMLCGEHVAPDAAAAAARAAERGIAARYWSPEMHEACFGLPRLVQDVIAPAGPPYTFGRSPEGQSHEIPRG